MTGGNEAQHSDRFDLLKNMAFTFIIRIFWQFHAVTVSRFRLPVLVVATPRWDYTLNSE
ncbi:MAG: hypothetical protein LBC02_14495 [Planctomycetaceae bacterium]|nr:hypothetical protein [Planctomycetaceae bacterium]